MDNPPKTLLVVTIDLGNNIKDEITIREGDSLSDLSLAFCQTNSLSQIIQPSITSYLQSSLEAIQPPKEIAKESPIASQSLISPGVRLYTSGLMRLRKRESQRKLINQERQKAELEGVTFKPRINKSTVKAAHSPHKPVKLITPELQECTFSPSISKRSQAIIERKGYRSLVHKTPRPRQDATQERDQRKMPLEHISKSIERLHTSKIKLDQQRYTICRKSLKALNESVDGLFHPKTGRSPLKRRTSDVFSYLSQKKPAAQQEESPSRSAMNPRSSQIYDKIKSTRFKEIFEQFKPEAGLVCYRPDIGLPVQIESILTPMLEDMQVSGQHMNFDEFADTLDSLIKILTPEERHTLVFSRRRVEEPREESRENRRVSDTYARLMEHKSRLAQKVEYARKERAVQELAECSFRPNSARLFM